MSHVLAVFLSSNNTYFVFSFRIYLIMPVVNYCDALMRVVVVKNKNFVKELGFNYWNNHKLRH